MLKKESEAPSRKRRCLGHGGSHISNQYPPQTFSKSISPPSLRGRKQEGDGVKQLRLQDSPFHLTWVRDLPDSANADAISVKDILGDPLIAECWEFNYLHDLNFLMNAFDQDVRHLIKVHIVHGFWKHEDPQRLRLVEQATKFPNITLHTAYMPEMFGTHHSKMLVLIRHDSFVQIIIHTANMIEFDWTNMSQGLWKSPLLPKITTDSSTQSDPGPMGSGSRFKFDFLNYLRAYDLSPRKNVCKDLVREIAKYDFSSIRAGLIASVPGRQGIETDSKTTWGWLGLQNVLKSVPILGSEPEIVIQISSIGTLGQSNKWLNKTLFPALSSGPSGPSLKAKFRIIFPTADEVRRSLNGYDSGSAIHIKTQTAAQAKQLQYLKPMLCHWAGNGAQDSSRIMVRDAGRKRAAPHIKTYVRFSAITDSSQSTIDWMLVTSANLSKQAWGEALNAAGDVRICSYEIGVLVWPGLFGEDKGEGEGKGESAIMMPTFQTDTPSPPVAGMNASVLVGARLPYDLPLVPYAEKDEPWCATASY